jgi:hypothetical protein
MEEEPNPYRSPVEPGAKSGTFGCLILSVLPFVVTSALCATCAVAISRSFGPWDPFVWIGFFFAIVVGVIGVALMVRAYRHGRRGQ